MYTDHEPLDCLNLSVKYVGHWGYIEGLRELYQNFMDACIENYPTYTLLHRKKTQDGRIVYTQAKRTGSNLQEIEANYISYDRNSKTLIFENDKSFPICCMLMGTSIKAPGALGQFGQGMKVSMIVLIKNGMDVKIESGQNNYYPTLKKWDHKPAFVGKYQHDVLYMKHQGRKFYDKTKVTIQNIDQEKFEEFLYTSLALLDQSKYDKITCEGSTLIFPKDTKLIGKVYKKGVRLQLHQSENSAIFEHYAYDFEKIQVGRDRDCVNNVFDLYKLQSQLHFNIICKQFDKDFLSNNPHLKEKLKTHLTNISKYLTKNNYQTHFFHHFSPKNKAVCDLIYDKFLQRFKNPAELYPKIHSLDLHIQRYLSLYGLQSDFYPTQYVQRDQWYTICHANKYSDISLKIQKEILTKQTRDLTPEESAKIQQIKSKIAITCPEIMDYTFKVKLLRDIPFCKSKNPNEKIIEINPEKLTNNQNKIIRDLLRMLLL